MKILYEKFPPKRIKNSVVTLGNFDGLHLGHQKILRKVAGRAKKLKLPSVVYTFEPHPLKVVTPKKSPPLITGLEEKIVLISGLGIDYCVLAKFTKEFARKHPEEFVEEVLVRQLAAREVWVGHDFSFGKGKEGTVGHLKRLAKRFGFRVFVIPAHTKNGAVVSSSKVRELITRGEVERAAGLLGRHFSLKGRVVKGRDIGRRLGFPTANLSTKNELIAKDGVYAGYVLFNAKRYPGVINVGTAPTFRRDKTVVEVHILDFARSIYGKDIRVEFVKRIRGEMRFERAEALVSRIKKDVALARRLLFQRPGAP